MTPIECVPVRRAVVELAQQRIWVEEVCMKFHITPDILSAMLEEYAAHCITVGEDNKPLNSYKRHFINWVYSQIRFNNADTTRDNVSTAKSHRDAEYVRFVIDKLQRPKSY